MRLGAVALRTATNRAVDAYVDRIAGLVSNRARNDILEPRETVYVSFALGGDGSASEFQVVRASRPATAQEVLRAATLARRLAPFDAPGDSIAQCVADSPFFVWIELPALTRGPIRMR